MTDWINRCHFGDVRDVLRRMVADGVQVNTIVTSPPYWGLRDYGHAGQIGLEPTLPEFIGALVDVFDLCRQVLADDGTAWINMGDSYAANRSYQVPSTKGGPKHGDAQSAGGSGSKVPVGLKPKDLIGQPWRLAFALQDAGWYLRQDIVWHKPNPMPESVRDRCTKSHEYIFMLSKSERYFFDVEAIKEPAVGGLPGNTKPHKGAGDAKHRTRSGLHDYAERQRSESGGTRNKRSVWTVATEPYSGAHFATFPTALIEPCILAGTPPGGIVLDPFFGSGTTGQVAQLLGRKFIGIELNPAYKTLQDDRLRQPALMLEAA